MYGRGQACLMNSSFHDVGHKEEKKVLAMFNVRVRFRRRFNSFMWDRS